MGQIVCTREHGITRENCATTQFKNNTLSPKQLLDQFKTVNCRQVVEQPNLEEVYAKYDPKSEKSLEIRNYWLTKYFHVRDCKGPGSYVIINCQTGQYYRGITLNLNGRQAQHWLKLVRGVYDCERMCADIDLYGIDNFVFVITGGVIEPNYDTI